MKVMAPPHPFQTFSRNKKMQAKCHSAVKQQEHLLVTGKTTSCAGAEQLRSGRRGGNSILYYRDAQSTPKMSMNFQCERNCPSPANSHTETLDIQFIPLIHGHKDVYAVTHCRNQMFATSLEAYSCLTKHGQQATQSHLDANRVCSSFLPSFLK